MKEHETSADIIAEMRDEAAKADMEQDYSVDDAAEMMREFAWRFEAAIKREAGNAAKLREAVTETQSVTAKCMDILNRIPDECGYGGLIDDVADELCDLREEHIKAALAAPPRNCDVGTPTEQAERWYWRYHIGHLCQSCPLGPRKWSEIDRGTLCFSEWLQMPYEEGGNK